MSKLAPTTRESMIADMKRALVMKTEARKAIPADAPHQYLVYTGQFAPCWINEDAVRAGTCSIGIYGATRYATEEAALVIARQVRNGNNERGRVANLRAAYEWEIRELKNTIALLEEKDAQSA